MSFLQRFRTFFATLSVAIVCFVPVSALAKADALDKVINVLATARIIDQDVVKAKDTIRCLINGNSFLECGKRVVDKEIDKLKKEAKGKAKSLMPDDPKIRLVVKVVKAAQKNDWVTVLEVTGVKVLTQITCEAGLAAAGPAKSFLCSDVLGKVTDMAEPIVRDILLAIKHGDWWQLIKILPKVASPKLATKFACDELIPSGPVKDVLCGVIGKALTEAVTFAENLVKDGWKALKNFGRTFLSAVGIGKKKKRMKTSKYYSLNWQPWYHYGTSLALWKKNQLAGHTKALYERCRKYYDSKKKCKPMRSKFETEVKAYADAMLAARDAYVAGMTPWARTWAVLDYGKLPNTQRQKFVRNGCLVSLRAKFNFPKPNPERCNAIRSHLNAMAKTVFAKNFGDQIRKISNQFYNRCRNDQRKQVPAPTTWNWVCETAVQKFRRNFDSEKIALSRKLPSLVKAGCVANTAGKTGLSYSCKTYQGYDRCLTVFKPGNEKKLCKLDRTNADKWLAASVSGLIRSKRCKPAGHDVVCTRPWKHSLCQHIRSGFAKTGGIAAGTKMRCLHKPDASYVTGKQEAGKILHVLNGGKPVAPANKKRKGKQIFIPAKGTACKQIWDPLKIHCKSSGVLKLLKVHLPGTQLGRCASDPRREGADKPCYSGPLNLKLPGTVTIDKNKPIVNQPIPGPGKKKPQIQVRPIKPGKKLNSIRPGFIKRPKKNDGPGKIKSIKPIIPNVTRLTVENNINRAGADYRSFDLRQPIAKLCQDACQRDRRCKAYTFVKPGIQGALARCWLKTAIPRPTRNNCCVSGVKAER